MTPQQREFKFPLGFCQCGCGGVTKFVQAAVKLYVAGHHKKGNRFKHNHGLRNQSRPIFAVIDGQKCVRIPLGKAGKYCTVDEECWPMLEGHCWQDYRGYAGRNGRPGEPRTIKMHNLIYPPQAGMVIDHINGDGLDNRRKNLRQATRTQNSVNKKLQRNNVSGVHGVSWHQLTGKWTVRINIEKKATYLGLFEKLEDAIQARREAEREHYGNYVRTE